MKIFLYLKFKVAFAAITPSKNMENFFAYLFVAVLILTAIGTGKLGSLFFGVVVILTISYLIGESKKSKKKNQYENKSERDKRDYTNPLNTKDFTQEEVKKELQIPPNLKINLARSEEEILEAVRSQKAKQELKMEKRAKKCSAAAKARNTSFQKYSQNQNQYGNS